MWNRGEIYAVICPQVAVRVKANGLYAGLYIFPLEVRIFLFLPRPAPPILLFFLSCLTSSPTKGSTKEAFSPFLLPYFCFYLSRRRRRRRRRPARR